MINTTSYAPVPVTAGQTGSNRLTEPRLFILNGTQSTGQNEQPRFSESIGTSSTGY